MRVCILILDTPGNEFGLLRREFRTEAPREWRVELVSSTDELLGTLADRSSHHLVILPDEVDGGADSGLALIPAIRKVAVDAPVVVVAGQGSVDRAARAIAGGATDFLVRGENLRQRIATLLGKLRGLFEVIDRNRVLDEDLAQLREKIEGPLRIVGQSPPMRSLFEQIRRVALIPRPVLIVGERGTGKELVARAIHDAAGPASRPMVTVNCAAFNDALLESELFGHEKGAYTGADAMRRGKFEQADGGTLFLDEIGNMSLPFQEKILRVVEYGTFARVGGTCELHSSARIIAATNRDLRREIERGEFLADLHDRLAFETIVVPPLRERRGDLEVLVRHFLDQFARETPTSAGKTLSPEALAALRAYSFPGNVRELKNMIERAAYREATGEIGPEDLGLPAPDEPAVRGGTFYEKINGFGRRLIADAMRQAGDNQTQAARDLGLSYHQFRYYLKKYNPP